MAETFPPLDAFSEPNKGVIRRRGGEHHEKAERDYLSEYIREFGDPFPGKKEVVGGKLFEMFLLGRPDVEQINTLALQEEIIHETKLQNGNTVFVLNKDKKRHEIDVESLKKYFELVQKYQKPEHVEIKPTRFSEDLTQAVLEKLLKVSPVKNEVSFFSSVDTALDYSDGVGADGFFIINGNIITFDVSERINKKIEGGHVSADIFIGGNDISMIHELNPAIEGEQKKLAERAYAQQINALAERIVHVYEQRTQKAA